MSREDQYHRATAQAEQKKASFLSSAAAVKERMAPARLKQDLKDKASDGLRHGTARATAMVSERPIATGAAASAFIIYLFRRPLSALFRRMYVRISNPTPETSEIDDA